MRESPLVRVQSHAPTPNVIPWRERAACAGLTWMAVRGKTKEAREVCLGCPVFDECYAWVMDPNTAPVAGVVAGTTPEQRGFYEDED